MINYHLVILKKPYLEAVLDGKKPVESRFLRTQKEPFGSVKVGDILYLKESSGPVCGRATVEDIKFFENLDPQKIDALKERYNHLIGGSDEYWKSKRWSKFGALIWIKDIRKIEPIWINKRDWRGWVVLTERQNFGLFKSSGR